MIILNEKDYAERCLTNGIPDGDTIYHVLSVLSKYYVHVLEYKKSKVISSLAEFTARYYPRYENSKESLDAYIEKYAVSAKSRPFYEIDGVWITQKEIESIDVVQGTARRKLAFTLLCLAKLNNLKSPSNDFWVNTDYKDIFTMANIAASEDRRCELMRDLYLVGLIEPAKGITNLSVRVTFADRKDTYSKSAGDFCIDDFRTLGYEYLYHVKHENFIRCGECGILVRGNENGTRRFCNRCSGYIPMESKIVRCVDCGRNIEIPAKSRMIRCSVCQKDAKRRLIRDRVRRFREREKEAELANKI